MWLSLRWPAHEGRRSTSQEMSSFSLFSSFFLPLILYRSAFAALTPSLACPSSIFPLCPHHFLFSLSPISSRQYPFPSLLTFFLAEEAQCLCIKVTTGGGLQPAREENKVTADKWKKLINKNSCFAAADVYYTSCSFSFCLFCKIEVVTFYHFTCCLM